MKRRLLLVSIPVLLLGILSLSVLRSYRLELVYTVALNATLQKAPESFPESRIENAFQQTWSDSTEGGKTEQYLLRLQQLSSRLEKVQSLSAPQIESILLELQRPFP